MILYRKGKAVIERRRMEDFGGGLQSWISSSGCVGGGGGFSPEYISYNDVWTQIFISCTCVIVYKKIKKIVIKELIHKKFSDLKDMSLLIEKTYQPHSVIDGKSAHQGKPLWTAWTLEEKFRKLRERKKMGSHLDISSGS